VACLRECSSEERNEQGSPSRGRRVAVYAAQLSAAAGAGARARRPEAIRRPASVVHRIDVHRQRRHGEMKVAHLRSSAHSQRPAPPRAATWTNRHVAVAMHVLRSPALPHPLYTVPCHRAPKRGQSPDSIHARSPVVRSRPPAATRAARTAGDLIDETSSTSARPSPARARGLGQRTAVPWTRQPSGSKLRRATERA